MTTPNYPGEYPETGILKGKVVAITGGATGIGRAICLEMLRQGARVSILHLDDPATATHLVTLTAEIRQLVVKNHPHLTPELPENIPKITDLTDEHFLTIPGDISLLETAETFISETVKRFGKVTTFVSNAGVCKFEEFMDVTPDLLNATVGVNLKGAFWGTQAAARQMIKQGEGGSIIGISSISALVGGAQQVHYTPTKAGVLSLMQSCATALGKYGIRCNAILPGTIQTQLNEKDLTNEEKRKYMEARTPLGRVGVPSDIAGPAVFLASDFSRYMSGSQMLVDGGLYVNLQ